MRVHSDKNAVAGLISAVLVLTLGISPLTFAEEPLAPHEQALLDATNQARMKEGLVTLRPARLLMNAAREHAANMSKQNILSHELDGKNVDQRVKERGYTYFNVGENIAYNDATPEAAVESWMNSPGHRANILKKDFSEIGVGTARNEQGEPYYTQVFGRPQSAGATSRAMIEITNQSQGAVKVSVPGNNVSSLLQPGGTGMYSLAGSGDFPKAKVQVEAETRELEFKDGAHYIVRSGEEGMEVSVKPPADQTR